VNSGKISVTTEMKNIIVKLGSPWRGLLPFIQKLRGWAWKFYDRTGIRFVISGGKVQFMDVELEFPENVGLTYATPLFWNGPDAYDFYTDRALATLISRSKLFLDIGSNVGIYSVYAGVKFPQVKTVAFEPVPVIWEKNRAFHRANKLSDQTTLNIALSDRDGAQKIFLPIFNTGVEEEQTATLNEKSWQAHAEKVEAIEIQCLTLDTFAAKSNLPAGPCCVKIDVEGFEAAVFRGGKKFIRERRPWIVCEILPCEEFDPVTRTKRNNNRETLALLEELGYGAFAVAADGFFRMTTEDFSRPRELRDFLLIPAEKVSSPANYLTLADVDRQFSQSNSAPARP
jgi:FkbM family methyltransferase